MHILVVLSMDKQEAHRPDATKLQIWYIAALRVLHVYSHSSGFNKQSISKYSTFIISNNTIVILLGTGKPILVFIKQIWIKYMYFTI